MLHFRGRGSRRSGSGLGRSRTMIRRTDLGGSREIRCLWVGRCGLICWRGRRGRKFGRGVLGGAFGRGGRKLCRFCGHDEGRLGVLLLVGWVERVH